jgi:uncharacterized protein DUF6093
MTLGDDVMRVLPDFRLAAQSLMVDTGIITRPGTGGGTIDPITGDFTPPASTSIYNGPCRVRRPSTAQEQEIVFGDVNVAVSRYVVNLPHDAPLIAIGDVFKLTVTDDPEILDVPMRVAVVVGKSMLMYRQIGLEVLE